MSNLLILGGTGFVGRALLAHLVGRCEGDRLVVPTRRWTHGTAIRSLPGVELVEADVHDHDTLVRLATGCDAVINLVAVLHGDEERFRRVHAELPRQAANACLSAGVRRFVHVSALGAGTEAPSMYLRSKAAGEAVLQSAGLDLTILRPSVIFGAEDRFLNLFARLQAVAPVIPLAGASARFQPVWVQDVAAAIARCLELPSTIGHIYECAGPAVYTLADLVRLAGQWSGHERPVLPLPDAAARLQALVMEMLPGEPLMSRDNLASMRLPNIASGAQPGLSALGIQATRLEAIGPGYLGGRNAQSDLDRWRGGFLRRR